MVERHGPPIRTTSVIERAPSADWELIESGAVVHERRRSVLLELDGIGSVVWTALGAGARVDDLIDDLAAGFAVDRGVVEPDVMSLLAEMSRAGVISVDGEGAPTSPPDLNLLADPPDP